MLRPLLLLTLAAGPVAAQVAPPLFAVRAGGASTGWVQNSGAQRDVIASLVIHEPGVDSLRLVFGQVHLGGDAAAGTGAELRLTSLGDGQQQTLDARQVQDWELGTAWFNGDALLLELLASPQTGFHMATVGAVEVGLAPGGWESQCGPADDRVPSNDPRVARLLPSGCTAWMVNDCGKCFLSAGHCGSGNTIVEFNVPFSNANGSWNHPPPSDQYAIQSASKQLSNAFGNDWFYFGTVPNSVTGLSAFEAQGAAFDLASPPPVAGHTIRITGHGSDSTPDLTYNQVQQTHAGPFVANGAVLQYQADTTGGNSGSPVIWEQGDVAIGVHTNAGCGTGGGANQGTSILAPALQAALANPLGVCAEAAFGGPIQDLGQSKVSTIPFNLAPSFTGCGTLAPGSPYRFTLGLPILLNTTTTAYLFVGLQQLGVPFHGGVLVPSPDLVVPHVVDTSGGSGWELQFQGSWPAGMPSGTVLFAHWWVLVESTLPDAILASNAVQLTTP